ncbi:MAG: YggT family protein [Beijerinckiaceae bacterium]
MRAILDVLLVVLQMYSYVVIAAVVMSWLIAFNVINTRNEFVNMIVRSVYQLTEPLLAPIRRRMPDLGGLDLSPIVLLLGIFFLQNVIVRYVYPNVF